MIFLTDKKKLWRKILNIYTNKPKKYLRGQCAQGNFSLSMEDGMQEMLRQHPVTWPIDSPQQKYFDYRKWVYEEYEGANWNEMSILQFSGGPSFTGGNVELKNGYKDLLDPIQKTLNIRTSSEVKQIEHTDNDIIVTVFDHATSQFKKYQCKFIVCTTSIGVLKDSIKSTEMNPNIPLPELEKGLIRFIPPLPDWKVDSLNCYKLGLMDKVILQFPKQFWGPISRITYVGNEAGDFPWFDNVGSDPPALLGWTACRFADKMEAEMKSDDEVVQHCMQILRKEFPDAPDPIFAHVTRWRTNPFTRGAYTFITTGATTERAEKISLPVGNIFFAGEAYAKEHIGCVHGAFITGAEAAEQIIKLIG
mmetsp:Transcript_131551/g.196047  ORF Transcript_131551/g.196047 Transcript_131551/m.196047 type:complete len:363 (-) Transcript_131551:76-1164(-)